MICVADNLLIHRSSESGLTLINPADNTSKVLISSAKWAELVKELGGSITDVILSRDQQWAMLVTNVEKVSDRCDMQINPSLSTQR